MHEPGSQQVFDDLVYHSYNTVLSLRKISKFLERASITKSSAKELARLADVLHSVAAPASVKLGEGRR